MKSKISHKGVVESVENNIVRVRILQTSACAQCKVANHCSASESKEKTIEVVKAAKPCRVGEEVNVVASSQTGFNAVLLGFGVPFIVLVAVVWLMMLFTGNEPLSALTGIGSLIPYYLILYAFRQKLRDTFSFSIE